MALAGPELLAAAMAIAELCGTWVLTTAVEP